MAKKSKEIKFTKDEISQIESIRNGFDEVQNFLGRLEIQRIQAEEESAGRTLEKQSQHEKQRAAYKDELERKRMVDQINAQRHLQEEERQKAEEALQRQEAIRLR